MKKIISMLLVVGSVITSFVGCSNTNVIDDTTILTSINDSYEIPIVQSSYLDSDATFNKVEIGHQSKYNDLVYSVNDDNCTVTIIGSQNPVGELNIPNTIDSYTVTDIGDYAFFKTDVTEVNFPKTIVKIGEAAFYGCPKLKTVSFAENDTPLVTINCYSFANCESLESVVIPIPTTIISNYAFTNCSNLSKVVIDETAILKEATFWGCPGSPVEYEENTANIITVNEPDGYEYSDWTTVDTIVSETPMQTTADDTRRVVSNGYTTTLSEEGTKIIYKYIIQERERKEKYKEQEISTYNYGMIVEEDGKVDVKWYYNQPSVPAEAVPFSKTDAQLDELVKELEEMHEEGKLLIK